MSEGQVALQVEGMTWAKVWRGSGHIGFGRQFSGPEDCSG